MADATPKRLAAQIVEQPSVQGTTRTMEARGVSTRDTERTYLGVEVHTFVAFTGGTVASPGYGLGFGVAVLMHPKCQWTKSGSAAMRIISDCPWVNFGWPGSERNYLQYYLLV